MVIRGMVYGIAIPTLHGFCSRILLGFLLAGRPGTFGFQAASLPLAGCGATAAAQEERSEGRGAGGFPGVGRVEDF